MTPTRRVPRPRNKGFSLIEVAVVIAIVATLLGTLLVPLATQVEASKIKSTDATIDEIREALIGYAMINGRLPCPDTDLDGQENHQDPSVDDCTANDLAVPGFVPWADLGTPATDAWGRLFRYRVTSAFAQDGLSLSHSGDILINARGDNPATGVTEQHFVIPLAMNVPVMVLSHGQNGYGGTLINGVAMLDPNLTIDDERNNRDPAGTTFVARTITAGRPGCDDSELAETTNSLCEFDDRVAWISTNVLFNRLVTAGKLP
ncbi:MAG: type II secretion system protein [Chromatiales bacterium]|nr:type II secretion system protein [Chromatiales bacterium]